MLSPPTQPPDNLSQYSTFLLSSFDPNEFAHSIVNNEPYPAADPSLEGTGDVSAALAKLNFGVEDLTRQLKSEISKHHSSLLLAAASLGGLEQDLGEVRRGIGEVESGVVRLKRKITAPHTSLSSSLTLLTRLRRASSLARRASRFTVLARRLESQMGEIEGWDAGGAREEQNARERRERAMAEAALTLAELETLLTPPTLNSTITNGEEEDPEFLLPIQSLTAISTLLPAVESSRERVVTEMESMVQKGLTELDNPLLASSLQTAHNLSVLPSLVESLLLDLTETVTRKVKACFDMNSLGREISAKDQNTKQATSFVYKSRARNEPTTVTMPLWTSAIWSRFESLVGELGGICIKVYTLEKILKLKTDVNGQTTFLDEAMTVLDNKPSLMFWTTLSSALETQAKEAVRTSTFIQQTLSTGYPRFLRLFQEFFSKIAVHTDTVYTLAQQSPETVLVLRSISPFETLYLTRSTNRLTESVQSSFSISSSLSSSFTSRPPTVPTANEGLATARAVVNELDAARFDPLLVKAIAKAAARAIDAFVGKSNTLIQHDHAATSLLGPLATPAQHANADLAGSLYHLWLPLARALPEHSESVRTILKPAVEGVRAAYLSIANPLIMAVRREFSLIITRMHRTDYAKKDGGMLSMGGAGGGGASSYMTDLTDKLTFVREELLGSYRVGDLAKEWALDLARFTVQTFVLHASIVRCPSEAGKLKLTADTTALEFAISQYLSSHSLALSSMGDQFKALRAFRPLLFLDNAQLSNPTSTTDVPTLILLHHVLSRSSLPLPHQTQGWTESEYVRWLNEHGEKDRIGIIERTLKKREELGLEDKEMVFVDIVRAILGRRSSSS